MTIQKIGKACIACVALSGVAINIAYGVELLKALFDPQFNNTVREILISAIALEFGWAALLLWVIGKPCERRHILLFTAIPMIIGNLLHSINQAVNTDIEMTRNAINMAGGLFIAGLFVVAFFLGKPTNSVFEQNGNDL
jgi:hypothetical protein